MQQHTHAHTILPPNVRNEIDLLIHWFIICCILPDV